MSKALCIVNLLLNQSTPTVHACKQRFGLVCRTHSSTQLLAKSQHLRILCVTMAASDVATPSAEERSSSEAVRFHMQDQADDNSRLKKLLETLDDQANCSSRLTGLLEELEGLSDDSPTLRAMLDRVAVSDAEFEAKYALIEESRALVKREQDLRAARIAQRKREFESEFQMIIEQMERAHEDAVAANERYQKALRFIDTTCNHRQSDENKDFGPAKSDKHPSYCELSLSRGRPEPEPVSDSRESSYDFLHEIDKPLKRLTVRDITDSVTAHPKAGPESSPGTGTSTPLQMSSLPESDSSADSSSSCSSVNATPRFGMKAAKVVTKKSPVFVPRLDLSGTEARSGVGPSVGAGVETSSTLNKFQLKPSQPLSDHYEIPGRRTSRRPDSARLISMTDADDRFGSSSDSARMMLSRIKRRAKGAPCNGEAGEPINEDSVTSGKYNNVPMKKPSEDLVVQSGEVDIAEDLPCEPSILEIAEPVKMQSVHESGATKFLCKDEAHHTPAHEPRISVSLPISNVNPVLEMPMPCDAANVDESTPMKAKENVDGVSANLQASTQERRIHILLWPTGEKLSTLKTLNNTMFLWEDNPNRLGSLTSMFSNEFTDLVLNSLLAAKESQRRLFDSLDSVQGAPRRGICCSAVLELVRAYPPERLVPISFINVHFVPKFLQQTVIGENCLKLVSTAALRSAQDSEAAEFWDVLAHHVASVADHKMTTVEESAKNFAAVLLHELREADIVGDAKLARYELQSFLTRCFRMKPESGRHTASPRVEYYEDHDISNDLLPVSDTARTYISSAPSQTQEIAIGRQVRDIPVTRGRKSELPLVAAKPSRKLTLSVLNSLKFWKRKPQKVPAVEIDYLSTLTLDQSTDRSERSRRAHTVKQYGFSLKL